MENKEPFIKRADAYIFLANEQLSETETLTPGEVSASFLFGAARFNAWVAACEFESAENMKEAKDEITEYFLKEYKQMLEQHIDSHIEAFEFK
ncbi:MAG: DUF3144 domain-containing protein [Arcobacter sp.]|nr:MAG: DUF3144 domain-containing protein [Arcobacter sp.]